MNMSFEKPGPPPDSGLEQARNILFVLPNLQGGGAERAVITLLRYYRPSRFKPHLAVVDLQGPFLRDVPSHIPLYDLRARRVRDGLAPLYRLIRRLRPDILFSTLGHLNLALLLARPFFPLGTRLIVRETTMVSRNLQRLPYGWFWKGLYRTLYRRAEQIICPCQAMAEDLFSHLKVPRDRIRCIPNPVDVEEIRLKAGQGENPFQSQGEGPHLVAAGRLSPEKGFDRLIEAFSSLSAGRPRARLWILGRGPLAGKLNHLVHQKKLDQKVFFPGFQANPFIWFRHADLFVLSSHFEGFPNTLLEALACGCPVVALAHPGGTGELLDRLGLQERLVTSLELWSPSWWDRPLTTVGKTLSNHFNPLIILDEYVTLFNSGQPEKA
jgi:glycosyltransferase involved in cell wall biosynthesis